MIYTRTTISEDEFIRTYQPQPNHLASHRPFNGCLFETYGVEVQTVQAAMDSHPDHIWTVLDVDGEQIIANGFHHVNRVGYLLTKLPCPVDTDIEVSVD